jgi:hypothetical protein
MNFRDLRDNVANSQLALNCQQNEIKLITTQEMSTL